MASRIRQLPVLGDADAPRCGLRLWANPRTRLSCHYAPFEYVNRDARLVLVGITPGRTQMNRALNAARDSLQAGLGIDDTMRAVKRHASLSGPMRRNVVAVLNRLGYPRRLGIDCASSLWAADDHLVQFCSLLKYPVFLDGRNYSGTPDPLRDDDLNRLLHQEFVRDMRSLPSDALLVPLGDTVLATIVELKRRGSLRQPLATFEGRPVAPPHPSGANAESIALLLAPDWPSRQEYAERMYRDYLARAPWKAKPGGRPQTQAHYEAARSARWQAMLQVRLAHGLR